MGVSIFSGDQHRVMAAALLLVNKGTDVDAAIEQFAKSVSRYRRLKLKERPEPRVSLERARALERSALTARRNIRRLDRWTRRFVIRKLANSAGEDTLQKIGAKRLIDVRSALLELARFGRQAANRAKRKIHPGLRPADELLSELAKDFGRIMYDATGQLPRVSRKGLLGNPGARPDITKLVPKVRVGAEARALAALLDAALLDAAGVRMSGGSLIYLLRLARDAAKERARASAR
jgi:hypothetical protein